MRDQDVMKKYWTEIGGGDKANWHIAHIDDEDDFFASGAASRDFIFGDKLDLLPSGSAVLDIGCGKGRVARSVAETRPDIRVWGLDVASSMIAKAMDANKHIINLNFVVGDGVSLSCFPDNIFDFVYSFIVFQHLPRHIVAQYIEEAARVLKPRGRMVFQVQQAEKQMEFDPPWNDFRTIRYYTEAQARALVRPPLNIDQIRGGGHNFFFEATRS